MFIRKFMLEDMVNQAEGQVHMALNNEMPKENVSDLNQIISQISVTINCIKEANHKLSDTINYFVTCGLTVAELHEVMSENSREIGELESLLSRVYSAKQLL